MSSSKKPPEVPPVQIGSFLFDSEETPPASPPGAPQTPPAEPVEPHPPAAPSLPRDNGPLSRLMDENFLAYASYVICNRAIPALEDGLKPVQRRILHSLWEKDDGRLIKVATIVGHTMQYHPHGDASIVDALVNLANKRYLIQGQGNFGNILTGAGHAAQRYIECKLTDLAREELFNPKTTAYIPSYDGRNKEPVLLPSKLPILLMHGTEGIAVGLSTSVLPHNFIELLEAEIAILQKKPFELYPDFPTGGLMDPSEYADGKGRIRVRAIIEKDPEDRNRLYILGLPAGKTTETLKASIEKDGIVGKKIPIRRINDLTAETVKIELDLAPGSDPDKVIKQLYAFTACENKLSSNIIVLRGNRPVESSVSEVLRANVEQLLALTRREFEIRIRELTESIHARTLERIFVEERIYKRIETMKTAEDVRRVVKEGLEPFRAELVRDVSDEDVTHLLALPIRRISLFDINKNREEIRGFEKERGEVEGNLAHLQKYAVGYLRGLVKRYRGAYPRLTKITTFKDVDQRSLTSTELTIRHNREDGFVGFDLKKGEELFKCSSLDRLVMVWSDGRYKVMPPPDRFFVDKGLIYCAKYDREREYTLLYREAAYGFTYIKRFAFGGAIFNKEYRLLPPRSKVTFLTEGCPETLYVKYKPMPKQRINQQQFTPREATLRGPSAKGVQVTSKEILKIDSSKPRWWDDSENSPKGTLI